MSSPLNTSEAKAATPSQGLRDVWGSKGGQFVRRIMRAILYRLFRLGGELTAIVLGLGILLSWTAGSILDRQSTDLTMLRPNLKIWFADAFDGQSAEFGRLDVTWLPVDNHLVVTVEEASILDEAGKPLESFELIKATLARRDDQSLQPQLISARIKGGVLSYVEDAAGDIVIGLGPPETVGTVGPSYRTDSKVQSDSLLPLDVFQFVQINDATIYVRNEVSDVNLSADVDVLTSSFSGDGGFVLSARGTIEQPTNPAPFQLDTVAKTDLSEIKLILDIRDARPDQIAPKKGRFWELQGLAAPVGLKANIDFSRTEGLRSAGVDLNVGRGSFQNLRRTSSTVYQINQFTGTGTLEDGASRMQIEALNLKSPQLSFNSSGFLTELGKLSDGDPNSSPVFDLSLENVNLDMTPTFAKTLRLDEVKVRGQADMDSRVLSILEGQISFFDSIHDFDAEMEFGVENRFNKLNLNTKMTGMITPEQFLSVWPMDAIRGAREWLERSILASEINKFDAQMSFDSAFFEDRLLTPEHLQVQFGGRETLVKYMATMPAADGLSGQGFISGNQLEVDLESGRLLGLNLTSGKAEIPQLIPRGGDLIVTVKGNGDVSEMLAIADNEPFRFATRYGVDPAKLKGQGEVELRVTRPLLVEFPPERITYQVNGNFTEATAPFSFGRFGVQSDSITLDANKDRMLLSGPVDIGPWRADMQWVETFGENAPPTQYSLSGVIGSDVFDGLGLASRGWFDGTADVVIEAQGRGLDVSGAKLDMNLTNSALSLERVWMKPLDENASLTGTVTRHADGSISVDNAYLSGEGVSVGGRVEIEPDFRLRSLDLPNVKIAGLIDGKFGITPNRESARLDVVMEGAWLDVGPWTQDLFEERQSTLDVPLMLNGVFDTLILDPDYTLTNSKFLFSHTGEVVDRARLTGLSGEKDLFLNLETLSDTNREVEVRIPDASKAVSAFLGLTNTSGGELRLNAKLPPEGEEGPLVGEAQMRDFKLKEAPALAQLLSLASLTGLADTLSSGSMQFDQFRIPFTILGDDIAIRDARLYGPALGMTGDGDIDLGLRVLDFDGTIVPAYTANSILGDIPVLGDIFVQEKDGGLFALTYTVSGPFEKTQIAVNPLSALTPGFLRQIFKRDRTDADESLQRKIDDISPKSPASEPEPDIETVPDP